MFFKIEIFCSICCTRLSTVCNGMWVYAEREGERERERDGRKGEV